jgi:hypothetical protein
VVNAPATPPFATSMSVINAGAIVGGSQCMAGILGGQSAAAKSPFATSMSVMVLNAPATPPFSTSM